MIVLLTKLLWISKLLLWAPVSLYGARCLGFRPVMLEKADTSAGSAH